MRKLDSQEGQTMTEYTCKFCGAPSQLAPSEQSPPPDYCHEEDHLDRARDAEVAALVDKADTAATVLSNLIAARQVDSGYSVYVTDLTSALLPFTGDKP